MPSRRELKKDINHLTHDLITECYAYKHYNPSKANVVNKKIAEILNKKNELIHRVNHPDANSDPKHVKEHFNKIIKDLEKCISLLDDLDK